MVVTGKNKRWTRLESDNVPLEKLAQHFEAYNRTEAEYGWGQVGWVPEQYFHTYDWTGWFMDPPLEHGDGTVWEAYFPWAAGALLSAFAGELTGEEKA